MRKITCLTKIVTILGLFALLLATSAFALPSSKAFAATTHPLSPKHTLPHVKSSHAQPLCPGTDVQWTDGPTSVPVNGGGRYTYGWACAGTWDSQEWIIDWRDGSPTTTFWCIATWPVASCGSGTSWADHSFHTRGTFILKVYNNANSAIAAWYTVTVF